MDGALKKGVLVIVVLFIGFYLFTDPQGLAHVSKGLGGGLWHGLTALFRALITFAHGLS